MFSKISERTMHLTRWGFTLGWILLIVSLFYDPISAQWTAPGQLFATNAPNNCALFQGQCLPLSPYPMGARIFWGMVLPLVIVTLLVFGHEAWRRICPLSFLSQIPRSLGVQRQSIIDEDSWLARNALTVQFSLLFLGLNLRLLLANSDRLLLGIFLSLTILAAITIGFLFAGKTWCNYFCPMAPVQMVYSEPSGLFGSKAHTAPPKTITQSMCRTVGKEGQEKSACVACKVGCIDIDAEGAHWENIRQPDRKLLYYAYVGLVIGFYTYFGLYSGNWSFLKAGMWNETSQLSTLLAPGFFIAGQAIAIPKLIAVPLTLTLFSGATYAIGLWAEKTYKRYNKRLRRPLSADLVQSQAFAIATFLAFNLLFFMGIQPTLGYFPIVVQNLISWAAIVLSSLWLVKTWKRSAQRYTRERDANLLRRQLGKLEIDLSQFLEGRSLEDLKPDELYTLAKVLPSFTQEYRQQVYLGALRESIEKRSVLPANSLHLFQALRQNLGITDEAHTHLLEKLQIEEPQIFPAKPPDQANSPTVMWSFSKADSDPDGSANTTIVRPRQKND
ncbi:MAG: calcium-binding protein [Timaviella obliquedivisa GSE-PSE-MK23-08B]|jgi:hypothetical protein|nr:calcium-binding protein [Timaviella obliquedivisa GSE-PSE-MK23-08B]